MNNIEVDWKDEILSDEARYRIRNNNGDIVIDSASIDQITPVIQQGTLINKTNLTFPIGEIREFVDLRDDDKYLLCDGSIIKKTDYPLLEIPPLLAGTENIVREISHYGEMFEAFGKWFTSIDTKLSVSTDFGATWSDVMTIKSTAGSNFTYDYRDGVLAIISNIDNAYGRRLHISTDGINFSIINTSADYWNNVAIYNGKVYASEYGSTDVKVYNPTTLELINTIHFSNSVVTARGQLFSHAGMCAGENCIYIDVGSSNSYKLYRSTDGTNFTQVATGSDPQSYKLARIDGNVYLTNYNMTSTNDYFCIIKINDTAFYGIYKESSVLSSPIKKELFYSLNDAINHVNGIVINESDAKLVEIISGGKYITYTGNMLMSSNHTGSLYNIEDAKLPTSGDNPKYIKVMN